MANILELQEYFQSQPIAPIFEILSDDEKNDETALKFMYIVHYVLLLKDLYGRIANIPKLLRELLGFTSYKSFTYYDYIKNSNFTDKNLKCKFGQCQFYGPYMLVLTHMAINHNKHFSTVLCAYCCRSDLKEHFEKNSFQDCYESYLKRDDIPDISAKTVVVNEIISDFYKELKICAEKLGVCSRRQLHYFAAKGVTKIEQLPRIYKKEMSDQAIIYQHNSKGKVFNKNELERLFKKACNNLHGNSGGGLIEASNSQSVAVVDSDDEMTHQVWDEPSRPPTTSGLRISRIFSMNDRSEAPSCAPSTSNMTMQSNIDYGTNTPQPESSPFIELIKERYNGIQNQKIRLELEQTIWNGIFKAQAEDFNQNMQ